MSARTDEMDRARRARHQAIQAAIPRADFTVSNQGSIFILTPVTERAVAWRNEFLPSDALTWGGGVVVEHRFIENIVNGIRKDGLTVQ
jgi:hypothetical protein